MKAVQVRYTVRPEFAEQNKANVRRVMSALRESPVDGMLYSTFTVEDGNTFVHINIARDAATLGRLSEIEEFQDFQSALRASNPVSPPAVTDLEPVAAGFEL